MKTFAIQILASLMLLASSVASAQTSHHSVVKDVCTMTSQILGGERNYAIYLPPGYETSQRSYPVLYLLHGAGDDQTGWIQFGEVQHIADKAIADGVATQMVIVMPDADTGKRGYFNDIRGEWNYEDFFFDELIPHIESTYRVKADKRYRAVAGLSMGGGGAFMYAMHHPELFSSACPLSASTGSKNLDDAKARYNRPRRDESDAELEPVSDETIKAYVERHSALLLAENMPVDDLKSVRWYIDCGDDDFLYEGNSLVHIALRKRDVPHEFRIRDGGHRWSYWRSALPNVLQFVSESFHQN
ncbi:Endo-1,4-beta-xylanase Z precursor [Rubripirellula lacrimiformis]|uniref:Endo-1,4-beta-xylanase Z n=1 Tax=Rubripirellula lacrimiformis TaxID=1930273 RepID=A0A517NIZ6_9BACT|nr:alpha/beta hydrolase-fold protein [Rubripirellula lacrimiformis]QDT07107.1 Endo-1,4-beta-xylanase Z precursor [Rubripirellula lacrimiformis]